MIALVTVGQFIFSILGAGTVGGLVSGEVTRRLAAREARKKQLGSLLCDLLELRHASIGMGEIAKAFEHLVPEYKDALIVALPAILEMVANPAKLHEHYESAIVELAALDPLLAFQLRSKNLVVGALAPLSKLAQQNPAGISFTAQAFNMLGDAGSSVLDESIHRVAKELGWRVNRETRAVLELKLGMPELAKRVLDLLPKAAKTAQAAQAAPDHAAQSANTQPQANDNSGAKSAKAPE
jgi:ribosomal protein L12E/L44/L45/RPP1/RPP2